MKIILDGLGGEKVEEESVPAVRRFLENSKCETLAVATHESHYKKLSDSMPLELKERLTWIPANEKIGFDENPIRAIRSKENSSIRVALNAIKHEGYEAVVSFGHTGATVAGARLYLGYIRGVDKAGLGAIVPNRNGFGLLMDVGANLQCRPENLLQYANMADLYCSQVMGIKKPRIGLLNVGEEESKGDPTLVEAHRLFKSGRFHFVGNVEGGQVFDGSVDAVITNGITGNIVLKSAESLANVLFESLEKKLKEEQMNQFSLGKTQWLISSMASRHNPDSRGACRLLGVKGLVLIGHGNARSESIYSALMTARHECDVGLQAALGKRLSIT